MKIIEPSVEIWKQEDNLVKHVARCARVCYGRESGNDEALYNNLIKNKHLSMFRHESVYAICKFTNMLLISLDYYSNCPYIQYKKYLGYIYISTNTNFIFDLEKNSNNNINTHITKTLYDNIAQYRVSEKEFANTEPGFSLMRYTFCVTTQISTSRELNRVSPNNIAERSTRYVYEDGTLCRPHWLNKESIDVYNNQSVGDMIATTYLNSCKDCFKRYKYLIESGMNRQDARGVLPLDTATKCVYTYSINEWRHIIDLRYYDTTGKAHPNAKVIAGMIRQELMELGYDFIY